MTENETERCTKETGDIRKHLLCKYKIILNTYLSSRMLTRCAPITPAPPKIRILLIVVVDHLICDINGNMKMRSESVIHVI